MRTIYLERLHNIMPETTTSVTSASTKAADKAIKAAVAVSETLPTVVETAEVALEIPSKVVLNQRLVVVASVAAGAALGAAGLWGANKLRQHLAVRKLNRDIEAEEAAKVAGE